MWYNTTLYLLWMWPTFTPQNETYGGLYMCFIGDIHPSAQVNQHKLEGFI